MQTSIKSLSMFLQKIWGEVAIGPDGCSFCKLVKESRNQRSKSLENTFAYLYFCILDFIRNYLPQTILFLGSLMAPQLSLLPLHARWLRL